MRHERPRIALADAFNDEREMYVDSLGHEGFDVRTVSTLDLAEAVEQIRSLAPDAVLVRILPGRFGIELIRRLRADRTLGHRPMMILTSSTHADILREAHDCGAADVLILPITGEQIADLLRRRLRRRKSA